MAGGDSPADLGTKHFVTQAEYWKCLDRMCVFWREGRSDLAFDAAVNYLEKGGQEEYCGRSYGSTEDSVIIEA